MAFQLLLTGGLRWTTAGNSAILLATAPLLTAVWLAARGQGTLANRQWCGVGLGLIGVGLVVQRGAGVAWTHLGGDLLALGAAAAWAWYGLTIGPLVRSVGALRATAWSMVVAACGVAPLALGDGWAHTWSSVSWTAWAGVLYGATVGMVLAMTLWGRALNRYGPQQTMLYVYLEPVSAVVIAAVLLGEAMHPIQAFGALLTLIGVGLASSG
jgi:drug/metabolite transporter (DMT)-like permease